MKKVMIIITRLNVGGASKHVLLLADGLRKKSWDSMVVSGRVGRDESDMSYELQQYRIKHKTLNFLVKNISLASDVCAIFEIYALLKKEHPDIVHTHTSKAGLVGRVAVLFFNLLRKKKIKTVHTFHGHTFFGYFTPVKEKFFLNVERLLANYFTDKIITISQQQENEILGTYGVGQERKHSVIGLGVESNAFKILDSYSLRQDYDIPLDAKVFGIVGRIADIKNHKLFIESAKLFNREICIDNVYFLIVGDGADSLVSTLKKKAGDDNNVIFVGNQADPAYFYGAIDYLVLTSINEGTPVSILEAFACRIPVVSTTVGGVVDLIGNNERGFLVDQNERCLALKYKDLLGGNVEVEVDAAEAFLLKNYSVELMVGEMGVLYDELLDSK